MTIKYLAGSIITGLSSDTKPTTASDGSMFIETDTGSRFIINSGTWTSLVGGNLDGLTDVDLTTTPPSNTNVLTYTSTGTKWVPAAPATGITASSTDTLTNKTVNLTNNTVTDTSTAAGDLTKSNGTKFTRFAKGTANQLLRTNGAGTDIEWATISAGSGLAKGNFNYVIYYTGSQYEALNGSTGAVDFNHATNAHTVINSCIDTLTAAGGGNIAIRAGTYTGTGIVMKNLVTLEGEGNSTILKLANTTTADVISSYLFSSKTGGGTADGVFGCILKNLVIDGNVANNGSNGGYGIRKYGYGWKLENIIVRWCKQDGIYSEWSNSGGAPTEDLSMEDYWYNIILNKNSGRGLTFRGPHDTFVNGLDIWGNGGDGAWFESDVGGNYNGIIQVTNMHVYANFNTGTGITITGPNTIFRGANIQSETVSGAGGIGINVVSGGIIRASRIDIFDCDTGIVLNGAASNLSDVFISNTPVCGIKVLSNDHYITGQFASIANDGNSTAIIMGSGSTGVGGIYIAAKFISNAIDIDWQNAGSSINFVQGAAYVNTGQTFMKNAHNVNYRQNIINVYTEGPGSLLQDGSGGFGTVRQPSVRKWGSIQGSSNTAAEGTLAGFTTQGTAGSNALDNTNGLGIGFDTGTSSNTVVGLRYAAVRFTRAMKPRIKAKIKFTSVAAVRCFIGFSSVTTAMPASDILNTLIASGSTAFGIGFKAGDTTWRIFSNDGTGTGTEVNTTISNSPAATGPTEIEIFANDANNNFGYSINNSTLAVVTSDIPTSGVPMTWHVEASNSSTASKNFVIYYVETEQDK